VVAYNFMARMAEPVESGRKPHTIRDENHKDRHAKVGDDLQLYAGMRTKNCRKLRDTKCVGVYEIEIIPSNVFVRVLGEWERLTPWQTRELAILDGFNSTDEFFDYFKERRDRILIVWGEAKWLDQLLGRGDDKAKPRSGATFGTMPLEKAQEIVAAVLKCGFYDIGLSDNPNRPPWPVQYTLEELLIANRVVQENPGASNPKGGTSKMMHMADRGVAARYALAHYGGSPEALLESLGYTLSSDDDDD
jgi:hypothetical protein